MNWRYFCRFLEAGSVLAKVAIAIFFVRYRCEHILLVSERILSWSAKARVVVPIFPQQTLLVSGVFFSQKLWIEHTWLESVSLLFLLCVNDFNVSLRKGSYYWIIQEFATIHKYQTFYMQACVFWGSGYYFLNHHLDSYLSKSRFLYLHSNNK